MDTETWLSTTFREILFQTWPTPRPADTYEIIGNQTQ